MIVAMGDARVRSTCSEQATSTIPIVFAIGDDPVGAGLVASLGATRAAILPD